MPRIKNPPQKPKPKRKANTDDMLRATVALGGGRAHRQLTNWWAEHVVARVNHDEVMAAVREDAGWSSHFAFMTLMSAGIAILGLLLSSPAVVIGAMLISPLMGPIIGVGFALATVDTAEIRRNLRAILIGTVMAVIFCAIIASVSPLQTVTPEISSRTRPNLFDLLVALLSGLAATYAMVRGRHGAIVGVAIATALMPPIAVMGFGLATRNWHVLTGSSLLLFTNLMTIGASAAVLARLYGFAADLSPRQTRLQAGLLLGAVALLAIPLGFALRNIAWEALASREAKAAIAETFGPDSHVTDVVVDFDRKPLVIGATVLTPRYQRGAEQDIDARLQRTLGRDVELSVDQVRTANGEPDSTEIAQAKAATANRAASRIALQLASVAGIDVNQVLVDRNQRVARARAVPLPGASLATYYAIEQRIRETEPGWTIELVPPLLALPQIKPIKPAVEGAPEQQLDPALRLIAWAGARTGVPIIVKGPKDEAGKIAAALTRGEATAEVSAGGDRPLGVTWKTASGG